MEQSRKKPSKVDIFENRRKFPRLKTKFPVTITGPGGDTCKGVLYDLSPDGTQIRFSAGDGTRMLPGRQMAGKDTNSLEFGLQFDLTFNKNIHHIRINAHPVYLRTVGKKSVAAGMFFSEEKLAENKKISDFLFYQLQDAYVEKEDTRKKYVTSEINTAGDPHRTVIKGSEQAAGTDAEKIIPDDLEELVLQVEYPKENLELFKQLLYRVLTSLKVIQETTRHIDERIHILEHKISRKS